MKNRRLPSYLLVVGMLGVAVIVGTITRPGAVDARQHPWLLLSLVAVLIVGELRPISIARGETEPDEVSISSTVGMALLLIAPLGLVMIAQALALTADAVRPVNRTRRTAVLRTVFNIGQYAMAFGSARLVFAAVTHTPIVVNHADFRPSQFPAALLAGVAFYVVNSGLTSIAFGLARGTRLQVQLRTDLRWQIASSTMLLGLAPVVAQAVLWSPISLPFLLFPVVIVHSAADLAARREHEALHDGLTGLPNRSLLLGHLERVLDSASDDMITALLLLDLDHFKEVNDTLGHVVGDQLICDVAQRLRDVLREQDLVARLGGDEFAVVCPGLNSHELSQDIAARLDEALREPFTADGVSLDISWSVGVALAPTHADTVDLLLQRADVAMYAAKETRGARAIYDPEQDQHSLQRLTLASDLRRTLDTGDIGVAYQPQVHARTREPVGVEALVRWQHPVLGSISADTVVALASSTGLIRPLTTCVLDRSLAALRRWRDAGDVLSLSVNLTPRQLDDMDLPSVIFELLRKHGVPPECLILEVTESTVMADATRSASVIRELRTLGIGLSIDDFGTGYSSLAHLQRLAPDEIKIDRSFVMRMQQPGSERTIVLSTIELGHNLGLRVVAEGVEIEATAALLAHHGCDVLQGYAISHPDDEDGITRWLAAHSTGSGAEMPMMRLVGGH
jgi:diguanylate cyclase (GGDEF)-like protein